MLRAPIIAWAAPLALLVACGGDSTSPEKSTTTAAPSANATAAASTPARLTPAQLGDAIFAQAADGIQKLTALVESHPPAAAVKPKVASLKEATIQQLVPLGRQFEALSVADRAQVEAKVASLFSQATSTDWYKAYAKTTSFYTTEDAELGRHVQNFNIITQYAFFELLRKQEPAEAQRLGIQ